MCIWFQVTRSGEELYVLIDEIPQLNATLTIFGDLISEVMYLGGLPPTTLPPNLLPTLPLLRTRRQLGVRNDNEDNSIGNRIGAETTNSNNNFNTNGNNDLNGRNDFTSTGFANNENRNSFDPNIQDNNFEDNSFSSTAAFDSNNFANTGPQAPPSPSSPAQPEYDTEDPQTFRPDAIFESSPQSDFYPSSLFPSSDSSFFPSSSPASFVPDFTNLPDDQSPGLTEEPITHSGPVHFKGVLQDIRVSYLKFKLNSFGMFIFDLRYCPYKFAYFKCLLKRIKI